MAKFIDVLGESNNLEFVCVEHIIKVSCEVETTMTDGGADLRSLMDPNIPPGAPPVEVTIITIRMFTAIGESQMLFTAEEDANAWAEYQLGISDIVARSHPESD